MWQTYLDHGLWMVTGFILGFLAGRAAEMLRDIRSDTHEILDRTAHIEQEVAHHDDHP